MPPQSTSRIERNAYSYWIPRIYDEVYGVRSAYNRCVDGLYDEGQLTMNTANKILSLPEQMEEECTNGDSKYYRFGQKLYAIRQRFASLPERFSEKAFNLILNHYQ